MPTAVSVHHKEVDGVGTDVEHTKAHVIRLLRARDMPVTDPVTISDGPSRTATVHRPPERPVMRLTSGFDRPAR
ncbi:hypothetical protein GCM10009608_28090 [Pseudonocardia alaniniphila]